MSILGRVVAVVALSLAASSANALPGAAGATPDAEAKAKKNAATKKTTAPTGNVLDPNAKSTITTAPVVVPKGAPVVTPPTTHIDPGMGGTPVPPMPGTVPQKPILTPLPLKQPGAPVAPLDPAKAKDVKVDPAVGEPKK